METDTATPVGRWDAFERRFPDDDHCLAELLLLQRGVEGRLRCPTCQDADQQPSLYLRARNVDNVVSGLASWRSNRELASGACRVLCAECRRPFVVRPLVGTLFENTKLRLRPWFWVLWGMANAPNGVQPRDITAQWSLGQPVTAQRLVAKARDAMGVCQVLRGDKEHWFARDGTVVLAAARFSGVLPPARFTFLHDYALLTAIRIKKFEGGHGNSIEAEGLRLREALIVGFDAGAQIVRFARDLAGRSAEGQTLAGAATFLVEVREHAEALRRAGAEVQVVRLPEEFTAVPYEIARWLFAPPRRVRRDDGLPACLTEFAYRWSLPADWNRSVVRLFEPLLCTAARYREQRSRALRCGLFAQVPHEPAR